MLWTNIQATAT
ncbi:hypothetical protein D030_1854A, partial [Vibrio parahaemolyticus AQ3810]